MNDNVDRFANHTLAGDLHHSPHTNAHANPDAEPDPGPDPEERIRKLEHQVKVLTYRLDQAIRDYGQGLRAHWLDIQTLETQVDNNCTDIDQLKHLHTYALNERPE